MIEQFSPTVLELSEETLALARNYIENMVLTQKSYDDALHAAISTVTEMDVLLSWNMKHLANIQRKQKINAINLKNGYIKPIEITSPIGIIDYEG